MNPCYDVTKLPSLNNAALKLVAINDNSQILCTVVIGRPLFWTDGADGMSFAINDIADFQRQKNPDRVPFESQGRHALLLEDENRTVRDLGAF